MLRWHRMAAVLAAILLIWVSFTGTVTQLADMRALVTHAPETDPDMLMMRQHIPGPPNYSVVSAPDYTAPALPAGTDYGASIAKAAALGRAAAPGQDLRLVEVRGAEGKLVGHVQMGDKQLAFDLADGAPLPDRFVPPPQPGRDFKSTRSTWKSFHRFLFLPWGTTINFLAALGLAALIFTGLFHYAKLYKARAKIGRGGLWWKGGDWWRTLHRWIALGASVLVIWLTLGGLALSLDNMGSSLHQLIGGPRAPGAFDGDQSKPMTDAELAPMLATTLKAYESAYPGTGIKVLRLRYFVGYPQGVIVAADKDSSQRVFNARTGAAMKMWEPGYPDLSFPTGWDLHQKLKQFHRGDLFGLGGRWLILFAGLSLVYLSLSGVWMWFQLYRKRRGNGRKELFWK
ncbi:PepSY domain-containing protein [Novosphingobium flavum]|uniref:PepSY domain-containing protein n=1 Tax=Novosphingobium flavum TaxID=1778672 RepID=A0A7X1FUU1_9SPHN|nr:PepSY-associated TM helix domain-containing protein [Novosphingobium flavum]MBC2667399.1 PepSY domain-containing protein [Novosphingobium flavum]